MHSKRYMIGFGFEGPKLDDPIGALTQGLESKQPMIPAGRMRLEHRDVVRGVMRKIKRGLDPNNILNPGKMGLDA